MVRVAVQLSRRGDAEALRAVGAPGADVPFNLHLK